MNRKVHKPHVYSLMSSLDDKWTPSILKCLLYLYVTPERIPDNTFYSWRGHWWRGFPFNKDLFLFFFSFFYFNWRIITLQYCDGFCHTSAWTGHRYTHVPPHSEPRSHLPPHLIPLGCPRAPALCTLLHASNLHRSNVLHMVMYVFQCCSQKSVLYLSVSPLLPCM